MKKIYIWILIIMVLVIATIVSGFKTSKSFVLSSDVKGEAGNIGRGYYIVQLNEYNFMPLAEEDISKNYAVGVQRIEFNNREKVEITLIKGTNYKR